MVLVGVLPRRGHAHLGEEWSGAVVLVAGHSSSSGAIVVVLGHGVSIITLLVGHHKIS